MLENRPYVISIAGLDPSAGAGLLADIKTFEQYRVYGFGICTAITVQSDSEFIKIQWLKAEEIISQLQPLITKFAISSIKIGIINDLVCLHEVLVYIRTFLPHIPIVFDPVLKASAGFQFHEAINSAVFKQILCLISLITPNHDELVFIEKTLKIDTLKSFTNVLLKGGHNNNKLGTDILFTKEKTWEIPPLKSSLKPKHGSGCVLASAITSNLALGHNLIKSCYLSKEYIESFLDSNNSLLGFHNHDR